MDEGDQKRDSVTPEPVRSAIVTLFSELQANLR